MDMVSRYSMDAYIFVHRNTIYTVSIAPDLNVSIFIFSGVERELI